MEGFVKLKGYEETHLINKETQQIYSLIKNKILKGSKNNDGYIKYHLKDKEGNVKGKLLHRLIAETFIPNPNNYKIINHKNGIKEDNRIENLEWCTSSHNNKEAYRIGLRKVSLKTIEQFNKFAKNHNLGKKLSENVRKNMSNAQKKRYENMSLQERDEFIQRAKKNHFKKGNIPWNKGKKGLQFHTEEWKKQQSDKMKLYNQNKMKKVICVETNEIFPSIAEASRKKQINQGNLSACLSKKRNIVGGFHWEYVN